jgi:hypothetical protein
MTPTLKKKKTCLLRLSAATTKPVGSTQLVELILYTHLELIVKDPEVL